MDDWTNVVIDHLHDVDPDFACRAAVELENISQQFPGTPRRRTTPFTPPSRALFPGFNTPASTPPSWPGPILRNPVQIPHNIWTPMHTGGATPNQGIQCQPTPFIPPWPPHGPPQVQPQRSSFPSPFRPIHPSPFVRPTPAANTPSRIMPTLPHEPPSLQQWNFPAGELSWSPHPAPHPQIPAANFWSQNVGLRGLPTPRWQFSTAPVNPVQAAQLTGGWPLPGAAPWWTQSVRPNIQDLTSSPVQLAPCLIPNPADGERPQILWDVGESPFGAKGHTFHATMELHALFNNMATCPPVDTIHISIHDGVAQGLWGPIMIQNMTSNVSVLDVLSGVYAYFQTPVSRHEQNYLKDLDETNHTLLFNTASKRGAFTIFDIKRIDSLGEQRRFWGLWITNKGQDGWHLNLGLRGPS